MGGIVLKHSLYLAGEQSAVANATAGIIFLGCPHLTQKNDNRWANWKLILKSSRKDISKNTLSQKDIEQLVLICRHFEQLDIELPVLSVFQSPATGTRRTSMLQNLRGGVEKTVSTLCVIKFCKFYQMESTLTNGPRAFFRVAISRRPPSSSSSQLTYDFSLLTVITPQQKLLTRSYSGSK